MSGHGSPEAVRLVGVQIDTPDVPGNQGGGYGGQQADAESGEHGSGFRLPLLANGGLSGENVGEAQAHLCGDTSLLPVGNALDSAFLLVKTKQLCNLCGATQRLDKRPRLSRCLCHGQNLNMVFMEMSTPRENITLNGSDNDRMEPSYIRLLECAREATAGSAKPVAASGDLWRALGETSAVNTNWKKRGVSTAGAMKAQTLWGCSSTYIKDGKLPKWVVHPHDEKASRPQEEARMTPHTFMGSPSFAESGTSDTNAMTAPVVAWAVLEAALMKPNREWPTEAHVAFTSVAQPVSDRAKSVTVLESDLPTISPGDRIAIDPIVAPWHDCVVVVKMPDGAMRLRRFRALAGGGWEALVPGETPMDNTRHALTLVGVVVALNKSKF